MTVPPIGIDSTIVPPTTYYPPEIICPPKLLLGTLDPVMMTEGSKDPETYS